MEKKILIVVDMQRDFIDGSLGTREAAAIVTEVKRKVEDCAGAGYEIVFTLDTHSDDYLDTQEGKKLPVKHCIRGTDGWKLHGDLEHVPGKRFEKHSFGSLECAQYVAQGGYDSAELVGLCTDVCVISNAMLIKAMAPELPVSVDAGCCAGVTPESHRNALEAMKMCQIEVTEQAQSHRQGLQEEAAGYRIEPMKPGQLEQVMKLYDGARQFMAQHGNPNQWPAGYPSSEMIEEDRQKGHMFVCMSGQDLAAVFFYRLGREPDYETIWDGGWLDQEPYGVVHRITTGGGHRGAGSFCLNWAYRQCKNLKIDTHRDNVVMQNLLKKNGFHYCGLIRGRDGGVRLAYQKNTCEKTEKTVAM